MTGPKRPLVCMRLAPLDAIPPHPARPVRGATLARLGRLAACLVALVLPALGIIAADTVHRVAGPRVKQAAASGSPSDDAAALDGASRTSSPVREALLTLSRDRPR